MLHLFLAHRSTRRLAAALCLAACGGFLAGVLQERVGRAANTPPYAASGFAPTAETIPGDLLAGNAFTARAAQAMEAEDYERALGHYRSALAVAQSAPEKAALAGKFHALGISAHMRNKARGRVALAAYEQAIGLFEQLGRWQDAAATLEDLAETVMLLGDTGRARTALDQAALYLNRTSADGNTRGNLLYNLADFHLLLGDYDAAKLLTERSLSIRYKTGDQEGIADCQRELGCIASDRGEYGTADLLFRHAETILADIGKVETRAAALGEHGDNLFRQGNLDRAVTLYREGLAVWQSRKQDYWIGVFVARLARVAIYQAHLAAASELAVNSLKLLAASNGPVSKAAPLGVLGDVAREEGDIARAERLHQERLALRRVFGNPRCVAEALEALAADATDLQTVDGRRRAVSLLSTADRLRSVARTPVPPVDRPGLARLKLALRY